MTEMLHYYHIGDINMCRIVPRNDEIKPIITLLPSSDSLARLINQISFYLSLNYMRISGMYKRPEFNKRPVLRSGVEGEAHICSNLSICQPFLRMTRVSPLK